MSRCYSRNLGQLILRVLAYQNTSQFPEAFDIAGILTLPTKITLFLRGSLALQLLDMSVMSLY